MPAVAKRTKGEEFSGLEIFALEIGAGGEHDEDRNQADQQVEENTEGVELNELAERRAGADGLIRVNRSARAEDGAEDGEEAEDVAIARHRLEQHQDDAEDAPDRFWQDADQIFGAGNH